MIFVAYCAPSRRSADILESRASCLSSVLAEALAGLHPTTYRSPHCGCIAWSADLAGFRASLVARESDSLFFATSHPVVSAELMSVPAANRTMLRDPDRIVDLLPPYVGGAIDGRQLHLFNDYLGRGHLYVHRNEHGTVWSNSPSACALVGAGRAEPCTEGWVSFLRHGRFLHDLSPIANVTLEPPSTVISCTQGVVERTSRMNVIGRNLFEPREADDGAIAGQVAGHLVGTVHAIAGVADLPLVVQFSGGRDSRMIAAAALSCGLAVELFTNFPPELDLDVATELHGLIGREVTWHRKPKAEGLELPSRGEAGHDGIASLHDRLISQHLVSDGQCLVSPFPLAEHGRVEPPVLSGVGGEFARALYYQEEDLLAPGKRTREVFENMRKLPPMFRQENLDTAHGLIDRIERDMEALDLRDLRKLDYYFVFQEIRRRLFDDARSRPWMPYLGYPFVSATIGQAPQWRVRTKLHADVVARLFPRWTPVPYAHELKAGNPIGATNLSYALRFWATGTARLSVDYAKALVGTQDIIHPDRMSIDPDDIPDRWAVAKQNKLISILHHLSFRDYTRLISDRMASHVESRTAVSAGAGS